MGEKRSEIRWPRARSASLLSGLLSIIAFLAAIATLLSLVLLFSRPDVRPIIVGFVPNETPAPDEITVRLATLEAEVSTMRTEFDAIADLVSSASSPVGEMGQLQGEVMALDDRLAAIESVILESPERALGLTLLDREMQNLQDNFKEGLATTRNEVDRVFRFIQWFLGAVVTLAIAVISIAASNIIRRRDTGADRKATRSESG